MTPLSSATPATAAQMSSQMSVNVENTLRTCTFLTLTSSTEGRVAAARRWSEAPAVPLARHSRTIRGAARVLPGQFSEP
jgi:hypothetical protein